MNKKSMNHKREHSDNELKKSDTNKELYLAQFLSRDQLVTELERKSSELRKSYSKKISKIIINPHEQYETNLRKKKEQEQNLELLELRKLVYGCPHCKSKLPQFITKKPIDIQFPTQEKSIQTVPDLSLFLKLEEKFNQIKQITRINQEKNQKQHALIESMALEMQQIDQKVKTGIVSISEQIFLYDQLLVQNRHLTNFLSISKQIPSYLKALCSQEYIKKKHEEDQS